MNDLQNFHGKTILITGANGMLGRGFQEALSDAPECRILALGREELDITERENVIGFATENPDIIIHCAAFVNAEGCEENPELCRAVQVEGTRNIADLAAKTGAKVLYPQSFLIFDGKTNPIAEDTPPAPQSVYGHCKLEAEEIIRAECSDAIVVRMAGFFGGEEKDKNFVGKFVHHLHHLIESGTKTFDVGDRVWQPTYTLDLARNCVALLAANKSGLYTMACHGEASFYKLAAACVEELGLSDRITINQVSAERFNTQEKARRPDRAIMLNNRLDTEGLDLQRPWRDALKDYLDRPYFRTLFSDI
ncbi:MAG: NAD(P)-dependent oxidoreductase [Rhodospirillaceae bacterium]|jgi:dTDP-4-dehydrorhamnose reductase|nr:NAD(P)-dependent oxidoreductase [Rhodospirillales bacterium]MBT3906652.1 NAD(P)-dependent oxidoreductase [Rhodospirillaceae bacterium]MBT4702420.1 NAD(P)-dependent oxidoreductase [Rhodospirillaceae bacterium]MBT5036721.1 NAD(P)-dependent oxidoreductase [Rhodospirillaceae bacterium]MBT6219641.1 NAD(P)-dependent oxidoreductase [Rhodospirillaceae bacterium]